MRCPPRCWDLFLKGPGEINKKRGHKSLTTNPIDRSRACASCRKRPKSQNPPPIARSHIVTRMMPKHEEPREGLGSDGGRPTSTPLEWPRNASRSIDQSHRWRAPPLLLFLVVGVSIRATPHPSLDPLANLHHPLDAPPSVQECVVVIDRLEPVVDAPSPTMLHRSLLRG